MTDGMENLTKAIRELDDGQLTEIVGGAGTPLPAVFNSFITKGYKDADVIFISRGTSQSKMPMEASREKMTAFLTRCQENNVESVKLYIGDQFGVYPVDGLLRLVREG